MNGRCASVAEAAEAQREIAFLVAEALDAGDCCWSEISPLVERLVGPRWGGAPPVVLARALSTAQREEAAALAQELDAGDPDALGALRERLHRHSAHLRDVLDR